MTLAIYVPDDDELKGKLEAIRKNTGISISMLVRRIIESHLASGAPLVIDLQKSGEPCSS